MKQKFTKQAQQESACYYKNYSVCTCNRSEHFEKNCVGCDECEEFISENDYFSQVMSGKIKLEEEKATKSTTSSSAHKNLALGKSKKALKREAKIEAEKNHLGSGFSLKDDPRFKDLFSDQ